MEKAVLYAEVAQVDVRVASAYLRYVAAAAGEAAADDEALTVDALCKLKPHTHALGVGAVVQTLAAAADRASASSARCDSAQALAQVLALLQRKSEQHQHHPQQQQQQQQQARSGGGGGGFLRRLFSRDATRRTTSSKHAGDATDGGKRAVDDGARAHSADASRHASTARTSHSHSEHADGSASSAVTAAVGGTHAARTGDGGGAAAVARKDDEATAAAPKSATAATDETAREKRGHARTPPQPPQPQTNYELLANIQREEAELAHKYNFERQRTDGATTALQDGEFSVIFNKFLQSNGKS